MNPQSRLRCSGSGIFCQFVFVLETRQPQHLTSHLSQLFKQPDLSPEIWATNKLASFSASDKRTPQ